MLAPIVLGKVSQALLTRRSENQRMKDSEILKDRSEARQRRQLQRDTIAYAERERRRLERAHTNSIKDQQAQVRQAQFQRVHEELKQRLLHLETREAIRRSEEEEKNKAETSSYYRLVPSAHKVAVSQHHPVYHICSPSNGNCAQGNKQENERQVKEVEQYISEVPVQQSYCQGGYCSSCR